MFLKQRLNFSNLLRKLVNNVLILQTAQNVMEAPGMDQGISLMKKFDESNDIYSKYMSFGEYISGPLNINKQTKQVKTVMGTDIILGENDFEALDLLVSKEGEYLTFQKLYEASWGKSPETDSIDYALSAINNIIIQINNIGEDFMWIENKPAAGYMFKTRWGQSWKENHQDHITSGLLIPGAYSSNFKKRQKSRITKTTLLTGAGTLVAAIILVFIVLYSTGVITPTTAEPLYIDEIDITDPDTPLASP